MTALAGTVFFLGAGATRADFSEAPVGDDLLHAVLASETLDQHLRSFLAELFSPESIAPNAAADARPRLDDVFTLLDAYIADRAPAPGRLTADSATRIRALLIASIATLLSRTLGDGPGKHSARFARSLQGTSTAVISTNYDLSMDNALLGPSPVDYGVAVRARLYANEQEHGPRTTVYSGQSLSLWPALPNTAPHPILLKLHGSLNWLYCPRCDELDVTSRRKGAALILTDPARGKCTTSTCTARYETVLVGPSLEQRYDHRVIRETWRIAEEALGRASHLTIIGYSMPEADYLIRAMLARHFARRSEDVLVVTCGTGPLFAPDSSLEKRYRRLFPRCRFEWTGFAHYAQLLDTPA